MRTSSSSSTKFSCVCVCAFLIARMEEKTQQQKKTIYSYILPVCQMKFRDSHPRNMEIRRHRSNRQTKLAFCRRSKVPFFYIQIFLWKWDILHERFLNIYHVSDQSQVQAFRIYISLRFRVVGSTEKYILYALPPLVIYDYVAWFRQLVLEYLVDIMLTHFILSAQ